MSIVNRRNAVIGWATWTTVKRVAQMKARRAVPSQNRGGSKEGKKRAAKVVAVVVAAGGALAVWKAKKRGGGEEEEILVVEEVGAESDAPPAE